MDEEWRPVVGFPDYAVSSHGRVKRVVPDRLGRGEGRILKQSDSTNGYKILTLRKDNQKRTYFVHRLVCEAFNGRQPSPGHQTAHNNGVKYDNRSENLRWATPKENKLDMWRHGTMPFGENHHARRMPDRVLRGREHGMAKVTDDIVLLIRSDTRILKDISADYGIGLTAVSRIRRRKSWRHV